MSGGGGSAPKPDPQIGRAALQNAATSREMLGIAREAQSFSRQQYADQMAELERLRPMFESLTQGQITNLNLTNAITAQSRDDYNTTFRPIEQRVAADAMAAGTPGEQQLAAGRAGVNVQRNLDMQRGVRARMLQSLGVNPNSGNFSSGNRTETIMGAAARAGAETQARETERLRGDAMRSSAAAFGRNMTGTALTGVQIAGNAAAQAGGMAQTPGNMATAAGQTYMGNTAASSGMMGNAAGVNASAAGILNDLYGNQVNAWQAQQQSSGGLGSALGSMAGVGMMMFSDEDAKTDKKPASAKKALRAIDRMRVEKWKYKPGTGQDAAEHVGTYAQDFKKHTGMGDGKAISVIDAIGVNMAATKQLSRDVKRLNRVVERLGVAA